MEIEEIAFSTHLQAFLLDADHHPGVLALHVEGNIQNAQMFFVFPGMIVEGGGLNTR